jgi:hypothetical protein
MKEGDQVQVCILDKTTNERKWTKGSVLGLREDQYGGSYFHFKYGPESQDIVPYVGTHNGFLEICPNIAKAKLKHEDTALDTAEEARIKAQEEERAAVGAELTCITAEVEAAAAASAEGNAAKAKATTKALATAETKAETKVKPTTEEKTKTKRPLEEVGDAIGRQRQRQRQRLSLVESPGDRMKELSHQIDPDVTNRILYGEDGDELSVGVGIAS